MFLEDGKAKIDVAVLELSYPIDLLTTLNSGQSFRWKQIGDWYLGVIFQNIVGFRSVNSALQIVSSPEAPEALLDRVGSYLRLDDDLFEIQQFIRGDPYIDRALRHYGGMRLLRQDPWECLISFICSANSNIVRISKTMEGLSEAFGLKLDFGGHTRYTFPSPSALALAGENRLRDLKVGFRAKYLDQVANQVANNYIDLKSLKTISYLEAKEILMALPGVGEKIADCVLLFSLDKMEAFPVDRWVRRLVEEWYFEGRTASYREITSWARSRFGPYAGYAQQYLFHARRVGEHVSD